MAMTTTAAPRKVAKDGEVQISAGSLLLNGELKILEKARKPPWRSSQQMELQGC